MVYRKRYIAFKVKTINGHPQLETKATEQVR
jgi:hypothetical protein